MTRQTISRLLGRLVMVLLCCGGPVAASASHPGQPAASTVESWAEGAQLFKGLGTLHRPITTSSPQAQAYFDQGLRLAYAFNHDEAARSFAAAAMLDSDCASCFWGVALTLGPNYNVPMLADRAPVAWAALVRARQLAPRSGPVEQGLIEALSKRYQGPQPLSAEAMKPYNAAYAAAMGQLAVRFPGDDDLQVLYAEAMMNLNPWKLWSRDGKPNTDTEQIVALLETVLKRNVTHPGANHYYIHAIEASPTPGKALPSADRLAGLMPAAGHLVHMPAHIYQRVGRYADACESNRRAVAADLKYLAATRPPGYYPMYLGHNYGFLAYAAAMEGRSAESLQAARNSARALPPEMLTMMPGMDFFASEPLLAMVRFCRWDDLLAEPRPDPAYPVMTALWLHGRGMALTAKGRVDEAARDYEELVRLGGALPLDMNAGNSSARDVAALAAKILAARLAEARRQPQAPLLWAEAAAMEDHLAYSEPADWFYPVRHLQGAYLLASGKPAQAEAVYREDLKRNPGNGWGLYGLMQALRMQKKEAGAVEAEYRKAWQRSDLPDASVR